MESPLVDWVTAEKSLKVNETKKMRNIEKSEGMKISNNNKKDK